MMKITAVPMIESPTKRPATLTSWRTPPDALSLIPALLCAAPGRVPQGYQALAPRLNHDVPARPHHAGNSAA
jgi:hypothetical protein